MMCDPCYKSLESAYPQLTLWWFEDKFPSPVAKMIERMAYPVWNLINLIGARNWNGASTVAECAIIYKRTVARIALKKVTGYFLVSSISDGGRGRRSKEALRRRAAAADARGWTKQRRKAISGALRSGPVRSGTVRGPVRGGTVRGPVRSRKPTVVGLN